MLINKLCDEDALTSWIIFYMSRSSLFYMGLLNVEQCVLFVHTEFIWIDNSWRKQTKRKHTCITSRITHKRGLKCNCIAVFPFLPKTIKTKQTNKQQLHWGLNTLSCFMHFHMLCWKQTASFLPPLFYFGSTVRRGIYQLYHSFIC